MLPLHALPRLQGSTYLTHASTAPAATTAPTACRARTARARATSCSRACSECTYCFGCVGLAKQDFHILNVKYTRAEYFRIVKSLEEELGIK